MPYAWLNLVFYNFVISLIYSFFIIKTVAVIFADFLINSNNNKTLIMLKERERASQLAFSSPR